MAQEIIEKQQKISNYRWIIVISYALANFVGIPTTSHFGLIFKDKFAEMNMPAADMTLIININSALSMSFGLINGPLLRSFGYRKISVIAACLFSLGLILTALADSITGFIIAYGVITAIGYGLSNSSFSLALNSYFRDDLNKASGVAMTLAGIGPIVYPPLINYLMHIYTVSGCMLVIGAMAMHMLVAAVLLQPLKWHKINLPERLFNTNIPMILPNVSTVQSIGKFSDTSFMPNSHNPRRLPFASIEFSSRRSSCFEVNHDVDSQSIYGFDQLVHRPSTAKLDQLSIARNFSKRTLFMMHDVENGLHESHNQNELLPSSEPATKLRWFESGSMKSIHLGSSMEIFKEPVQISVNGNSNSNRRKSSIFSPLRRQSQHLIQTLRRNIRSPSRAEIGQESAVKIPLSVPEKLNETVDEDNHLQENSTKMPKKINETIDEDCELEINTSEEKSSKCCCDALNWFIQFFDLDLLRDRVYCNILVSMSLSVFAEINFAILTPFVLTDLNFTSDHIAMILLVMAIADLFSRFFSPFLADFFDLSIRASYAISLLLLLIFRIFMVFTTNYTQMLIVSLLLGLAKGIRSVYMSIVIPSYIPIDRLASASALQLFSNGIFMMCFGPVLGLIKDLTGTYLGCIAFLNICTFTTVLMYSIEMCYFWYKDRNISNSK